MSHSGFVPNLCRRTDRRFQQAVSWRHMRIIDAFTIGAKNESEAITIRKAIRHNPPLFHVKESHGIGGQHLLVGHCRRVVFPSWAIPRIPMAVRVPSPVSVGLTRGRSRADPASRIISVGCSSPRDRFAKNSGHRLPRLGNNLCVQEFADSFPKRSLPRRTSR